MINDTFSGAILLLKTVPDADTADHIAFDVASDYFPADSDHKYTLTRELPANAPVDLADQYSAAMKDLPSTAVYLIVYPVARQTKQ